MSICVTDTAHFLTVSIPPNMCAMFYTIVLITRCLLIL